MKSMTSKANLILPPPLFFDMRDREGGRERERLIILIKAFLLGYSLPTYNPLSSQISFYDALS